MSDAVVLIEGSDPSLVADAASRAITELIGDADRSLALEDHASEDVDLAAVADGCATPPFLVDRRVVVLRDIGRFSTEELAPILSYLTDPLPSTALVLVSGGGRTAPKLAASAKEKGRIVATDVDRGRASNWVNERTRLAGLIFDPAAQTAVAAHLGEDLGRLVPLLSVLETVYGAGARLGVDDIEPYLGEAGSVTPWAFTDAIDSGDASESLQLLHRLLEGGDRHPLVVLAILHRHISSLMRVDGPSIRTEADAARAMGIQPGRSTYPAKKALRSAQQWGSANIAEAIALLSDAEVDLKGASAWPGSTVMEVLVARLCRLARARPASRRGA